MKETHLCSCCLSKDCYKNMCNEYNNGNRKEMYSTMLLNTFNVDVSNLGDTAYICDPCLTKLRAAAEFKEQVVNAQQIIKNTWNSLKRNIDLKSELDDDDFDDKVSDHFSDSDFNWNVGISKQKGKIYVIKLKSKENTLTARDSKSMSLTITDDQVPSPLNVAEVPTKVHKRILCKSVNKCDRKPLKTEAKSKILSIKTVKTTKKLIETVKAKSKKRYRKIEWPITQSEIDARENTLKLIQNSNLCLFRSLKTKYGCFMCEATFIDPSKLRDHSTTHTNATILTYRVSKWRGLSYKNADISNLKCNKCPEKIINLVELMKHLNEKHDITFSNTNHFLVPYNLFDRYQCVLCELKFNSFLRLSIHMNSHYANSVCEICGLSFINRSSLRMHVQSQHKEKKCSLCPAKFLTLSLRVKHLRKVHNVFNKKRYCNLCEKTFPYTYKLEKHKIEEHGAEKTMVNCNVCGKTFFHQANLKIHMRSVHIKERNYPCEICGTRFFTKCDQKRHERTHNDVRSFSCSHCDAKFKSKDSWRRHMRRQHGDVPT